VEQVRRRAARQTAASTAAPLVLLVDDHQDARDLYSDFFKEAGFRIAEAVDGDHALLKIAALMPSAVVMDLAMPVLDGWEATRRIKEHPKTEHVAVIVLTGQVTPEALARAADAGADVVLAKPCTPEALLAAVKELLADR